MNKRERLLAAARCQPVDRPPVWLMRQAGRYLPEYRALRAEHEFLTCCKTPVLCRDISVQPLDRLDVDAVIIFQDILTPLEPLGIELRIGDGGPRILNPVRTSADLAALASVDLATAMGFVGEAHQAIRTRIGEEVGLIGFCGAPFTLATYLVEGEGGKEHRTLRRMRHQEPALFRALLQRLAEAMVPYLAMQAEAGANVLMLFDTWAGELPPADFRAFVVPVMQEMIQELRGRTGAPLVYFPRGIGGYWAETLPVGADVYGIDYGQDLAALRLSLGPGPALQGNLDPALLYGPAEEIQRAVQDLHEGMGGAPGHIFNLGHGILRDTPVEGAQAFVQAVQQLRTSAPVGVQRA